jgi:hypothetical protein
MSGDTGTTPDSARFAEVREPSSSFLELRDLKVHFPTDVGVV